MQVMQSQVPFPALGQRVIHNGSLIENIILGIGFNSVANGEGAEDFIRDAMVRLSIKTLSGIATLSKSVVLSFLRKFAENFGDVPIQYYTAEQLEQETVRLSCPSRIVYHAVGCHGVAEAAALRATGTKGRLILTKTVYNHMTFALAGRRNA